MPVKPEINADKIKAELQELSPSLHLTVRLCKSLDTGVQRRETDKGLAIKINPKRIRSQGELDFVMDRCRSSVIPFGLAGEA